MTDPAITPELVAKHGLTPDEFLRIKEILGSDDGLGLFTSILKSQNA